MACTIVALGWANSPWSQIYFDLAHTEVGFSWGYTSLSLSPQHWINDALMAIFFFVVGLEVKREIAMGELSTPRLAALPVSAAVGGMLIPAGIALEHHLHPLQAFLVLPLFAFFNAGVELGSDNLRQTTGPIGIGIILRLVLGKQIGVTGFSWMIIKGGWADLPNGVSWPQIWGASCLAGVGFTMSLFITELAFDDPSHIGKAKLGILAASLMAGILGYWILARSLPGVAESKTGE